MPVSLNPQSIGAKKGPKILTTTVNKKYRVERLRDDLDQKFIEADAENRAKLLDYPYIDLYGFPIDTVHLSMMTVEDVEKYKIGIFGVKDKLIYLATPELNYPGQEKILDNFVQSGYKYKIFICSSISLEKIIKNYDFIVPVPKVDDSIKISIDSLDNVDQSIANLRDIENLLTDNSASDIIETILTSALVNNASDIHFEPEKDVYNLRFRLDGVLQTLAGLPRELQKTIESRIKILSELKLNVDNVPQDGRFSFKVGEKDIDVRVSMLPSNYGYSIVMRLLGTGSVALEMDQLGFSGLAKNRVEEAIQKPQGMILTTGPTGSGKTTTLYTFLSELNDGQNKIITLEDPVEYKLPGVSQTQIDHAAGYTFGSGLRSILRQDPDIVMVGEIRDRETSDTAVQASLTGHQVLSTIHTNDAAGAIPRMMEMGVRGYLLADSLSVVIGQRLVRRLCTFCKKTDILDDVQRKLVISELQKISPKSGVKIPKNLHFCTSTGCDKCNGLGYKGRIGLYEVMVVTDSLRELISDSHPSIVQVRNIAMQDGMITMMQDGILKALDGVTDIREVQRNVV